MLPFFNGGAEMIQNLADFTEEERKKAMERYRVLEPYLKNLKSVRTVSKSAKIPKRTLYNWINRYKNDGLAGLTDKTRKDKHRIKIDGDIFFIYTNEKLKSILNISSPNKLSKIKKELTQADLFKQIRVGLNKPNKLYIKKPEVTEADIYYISQQENDVESRNDTDVSKSYANDTELNDTEYIETENNDTNDLNDTTNNISTNTHSNHTNRQQTEFNNDALKFQVLEELPQLIKDYLSNFEIREIRIIKSVLLKGKKSFNNAY